MSANVLLPALLVSVMLNGMPIETTWDARIARGIVVAPLEPFVRDIAEIIETSPDGESFVVTRGDRSVVLRVGSKVARNGFFAEALPIAPYLRSGETIIPLAAVARALGATVAYDAPAHVLYIETEPAPLATQTPVTYVAPPPGSMPTFAPTTTPAPRPTVSGIPKPRRTPILIEPQLPR